MIAARKSLQQSDAIGWTAWAWLGCNPLVDLVHVDRGRCRVRGQEKSPTTRTQAVLIADKMMLDREAAFKPAR
jgi:hypothetical protein